MTQQPDAQRPTPNAHSHPCNFRLHRFLDRGWGEAAFEYRWDSTSGTKAEDGLANPDLAHCLIYELTTYEENRGVYREGFLHPPDPPFVDWKFRNPTDGRTAPVGLECFSATQGWAWDRHKLGGRLIVPEEPNIYRIVAIQRYCFHCEICGRDAIISGKDAQPHSIVRTFTLHSESEAAFPIWRYSLQKHDCCAWMDVNREGYVDDSAGIGFSPFPAS